MYRSDTSIGSETNAALGLSAAVLSLPALVLLVASIQYHSQLLAAGALAVSLGGLLIILGFRTAIRPPASGSSILIYLMALGFLWFQTRESPDTLARFGRGLLLLGAIVLLIRHDLARSGVEPRRRVRKLCSWLTHRTKWPDDLNDFQHLPEVRALQEDLSDDPSPVLALLTDPRAEVRAAALLALRSRPYWRSFEAAQILAAARQAREPELCAYALLTLKSAEEIATLHEIAGYLRSPAPMVRQAAFTVLLHNCSRRWPAVRSAVKDALSDPAFTNDGSLPDASKLSPIAICDLATWASENPPLSDRSIETIVEYYAAILANRDQPLLPQQLAEQVIDPNSPPTLRVELAHLLRSFRLITHDMLDRMSDADQPGSVRLVAAEAMLEADPTDPTAVEVLRGLGRQPNRETALAIAWLLQNYLGMDMGLPTHESVPPNSKAASEAARRVLNWAMNRAPESPGLLLPTGTLPRPQSLPTLSGLKGTNLRPGPHDRGHPGSLWSPQ
ncbi:MAG: hypothetical protein LC104_01370 [Bacteroidales bacterium]|nr:hypothetical protein [Bacteroidales bacterium]